MIAILSAPSNLGLRPPEPGSTPGASKAPEALREAGLMAELTGAGALDAGVVLAGRYVDDDLTRPSGVVRNQEAMIDHSRRLARRITALLDTGDIPLVLGGDCSVLLGIGLATSPRDGIGLVHLDGHTDFRHPGNSHECASVAGEDLAAAVGLHWSAIADIDNAGPYFDPQHTVHVGHRQDDEEAAEAARLLGLVVSAKEAQARTPGQLASDVRAVAGTRYWLQVDVDILDPSVMPAVDSPDPGGLTAAELTALLHHLAPHAIGISITVFDPDLDPAGDYARTLTDILTTGLDQLTRNA
ncbi:arginase family protein [Frondihabitans sp. 4ASC-45]|uniref:arginase family protein n=1 Tax=Frondihabitans sp. 4ASC-45 TaxID=3111636 RepID=UPI003C1B41B7